MASLEINENVYDRQARTLLRAETQMDDGDS